MSKPLSPDRLEAFSDGVIAVIITIMVLELHVPGQGSRQRNGLLALVPLLTVYLLSFVQIGHLLGQPSLPGRRSRRT